MNAYSEPQAHWTHDKRNLHGPDFFFCPWEPPETKTCSGVGWSSCTALTSSHLEGESHSVVSDSLRPHGLYSPWDCLGQNTGMGSLFLLQEIFPIQGSNPGLPHCGRILYQLSHQGSPRILEWVAIPSPADLPNPGIELGSPALQADSLPTKLSGKPSLMV